MQWVLLKRSKFNLPYSLELPWESQTLVCALRPWHSKCSSVCMNRCMPWNTKISQFIASSEARFLKLPVSDKFHMNRTICCLDLCLQKIYYISVTRSYCIRHVDRRVLGCATVGDAPAADLWAILVEGGRLHRVRGHCGGIFEIHFLYLW